MAGPGGTITLTNGNDVFPGVGDDNTGNENIIGLDGNDTLDGGAGNDTFTATGALDGLDSFIGGAGSDTVDYSALLAANNITVTIGATATVIVNGGNNDQLVGVENVTGGAGGDFIKGDSNSNVINGGDGNDFLIGAAGADTINGGNGNDFIAMDRFDTSIDGGAGFDFLYIQDSVGVSLDVGAAHTEYNYGWLGNDTFDASTSATGVYLIGDAGADRLIGSSTNDYIFFDGLDFVDAGGGRDALFVYQGNGQPVTDTFVDAGGAHAEYVVGGGGNDVITNTGSTGAALFGGAGNDLFSGGTGNDFFTGGAGADSYNFFPDTPSPQLDAILDFENGVDVIVINSNTITSFAQINAFDNGVGGTTINFGGGYYLQLTGFAFAGLDASDFTFATLA